jgi:hypothetical protein
MTELLAAFSDNKMANDLLETLTMTFPEREFVVEGNNVGIKGQESPAVKMFVLGYILGMQRAMS